MYFCISLQQITRMSIVYSACPCCHGVKIAKVLSAKDYTVSGELFEIWHCDTCSLRFTQNIPGKDEIGSYYSSEDYISHTDIKKGLINRVYHFIRRQTVVSKRRFIKETTGLHTGNILDVGAGTAAFLYTMQKAQWNITGIEPDSNARDNADKLYGLKLQPSSEFFHLPENSFDAITMWHVLEHVHELHEYLDQLKKLVRPNGYLFLAVPNYTGYDAKFYEDAWAGYDVPRHLYHFSPLAMQQLLSIHGLQLTSLKRMWYDSFYVSMLSEKYKTRKNNFIRACAIGFISDMKALFNAEKCSSIIYIVKRTA